MTYQRRTKQIQLLLPIVLLLGGTVVDAAPALSLNEAVTRQLEITFEDGGAGRPCERLLQSSDFANFGDNLLEICIRDVAFGDVRTGSSTGGGAASPAAIPGVENGFLDEAQKNAKGKQSLVATRGNWSTFFTVENKSLDRDASETEDGFSSNLFRVLFGTTYMASNKVAYSAVLDVNQQLGDYESEDQIGAGYLGGFNYDSSGVRLVAAYKPTTQLSFQIAAAYDYIAAERRRAASFIDLAENGEAAFERYGTPSAKYDYDQYAVTLRGAYEFSFGRLRVSPKIGFDWLFSDYGTHSEKGGSGLELTFHEDERESIQLSIGLQTSYTIATDYGVFIPQLDLLLRRETQYDARTVNVSFTEDSNSTQFYYTTDALDSDFGELNLGGVFVYKNGLQMFVNFQTLIFHDDYDSLAASAGLRIELN